jgi:hypothetical protein
VVVAASTLLCVAGVVVSGTRAYWIATALSVSLLAVRTLAQRRDLRRTAWLHLATGFALVVVLVALALPVGRALSGLATNEIGSRVLTLGSLSSDSSLGTRWRTFVTTNEAIRDHIVLGKGLGARATLVGSGWRVYETRAQYVDNVPQTVALKLGMVGLAALTLLWLVVFFKALVGARASSPVGASLIYSIPGLMLLAAASSYLVIYPQVFVLAVIAGIATSDIPVCVGTEREHDQS